MADVTGTRYTLLQRACDHQDQGAWSEFADCYKRFIYYILARVGVAQDDIEDVSQEILLILTSKLDTYNQDRGRFRSWLGTVVRNAAFAHLKNRQRHDKYISHNEGDEEYLSSMQWSESELDKLIEEEWMTYIVTIAMERIRGVFHGKAIEVFELGLKGVSTEEIARITSLTTASVYTLRKRVKKRLCIEVRDITCDLEQ